MPVNFVGQIPVGENIKIQGFVGPYAALGLGGKLNVEYTDIFGRTQKDEYSIKMKKDPVSFNDQNTYLNSLNFGLNFGLGFRLVLLYLALIMH